MLPTLAVVSVATASTSSQRGVARAAGRAVAGQPDLVRQAGEAMVRGQVHITAAALRIMERYPAGSCGRDPYQAKCPKPYPKVIFASSDLRHPPGWLAAYTKAHPKIKQARHDVNSCTEQVLADQTIGWVLGAAYQFGKGSMTCGALVDYADLYVVLWERWTSDNQLHPMASSGDNYLYGSGTIYAHADAYCNAFEYRWWRAYANISYHPHGLWEQYASSYAENYGDCRD